MPRDWDAHWLRRAWLVAEMSTCLRRHVGAVAVRDRHAVSDGFNGNMPGARHCDEGGCRRCASPGQVSGTGLSDCTCVHAEANVVAFAAREGTALRGATVYSTDRPCADCTKLLAVAGVIEVVYDRSYPVPTWADAAPTLTFRRMTTSDD